MSYTIIKDYNNDLTKGSIVELEQAVDGFWVSKQIRDNYKVTYHLNEDVVDEICSPISPIVFWGMPFNIAENVVNWNATGDDMLKPQLPQSWQGWPKSIHWGEVKYCNHSWKNYIGFTDKYEYCEKCNEKKNA